MTINSMAPTDGSRCAVQRLALITMLLEFAGANYSARDVWVTRFCVAHLLADDVKLEKTPFP